MDESNLEKRSQYKTVRPELTEPPNIVIQTAFLGDLLLGIPLFRRIKQTYPLSPLVLVVREGLGRLMLELGLCDEVYEVRKGDKTSYRKISKGLAGRRFQLMVVPHQSMTTALFSWTIHAELKVSYSRWWNFLFFHQRIVKNPQLPEALRQMSLLQKLDPEISDWTREAEGYELRLADEQGRMPQVPIWATMSLRNKLYQEPLPAGFGERPICVFPGSVWATKQWTEEGYIELAKRLSEQGSQIIWLGSGVERELCQRLAAQVPGSLSAASSMSLYQVLVLLAHSRLVICNDSGGQHLAAVAGAPTLSIFGPTTLEQGFRPWNSKALVAELRGLECRPCGKHGHRACPRKTHDCMRHLSPMLVFERAQILLDLDIRA